MIPDFFSELIAWRKFDVRHGASMLYSVGMAQPFPLADIGAAVCVGDGNYVTSLNHACGLTEVHGDCPSLSCTCGYYSYKDRADAVQHGQGRLLAKVAVWGRIAEHTRGYRAERMRILEVFVPSDYPAIDALAKRYGVPITIDGGAETWTSESPSGSSSSSLYQNQGISMWNPATLSYQTFPLLPMSQPLGIQSTSQPISSGGTVQVRMPQQYVPNTNTIQPLAGSLPPKSGMSIAAAMAAHQAAYNYAMTNYVQTLGLVPKAPYTVATAAEWEHNSGIGDEWLDRNIAQWQGRWRRLKAWAREWWIEIRLEITTWL